MRSKARAEAGTCIKASIKANANIDMRSKASANTGTWIKASATSTVMRS